MNDTAVIMITCKKFEQLWEPFFILIKKYWKDCPYKIYMITDFGNFPGIETIEVGRDLGFSSNLIYGLKNIKEGKIIYVQEDYLANGNFNNDRIIKYNKYLEEYNIGCLRLAPCPGPTSTWKHEDLGVLQKGDAYRVSTQTAIWRKKVLFSLLKEGESGGDFEIKGTKRSEFLDCEFLSVWREQTPAPYFITAIVRGVWQEGAIELLKKENISMKNITRVIK